MKNWLTRTRLPLLIILGIALPIGVGIVVMLTWPPLGQDQHEYYLHLRRDGTVQWQCYLEDARREFYDENMKLLTTTQNYADADAESMNLEYLKWQSAFWEGRWQRWDHLHTRDCDGIRWFFIQEDGYYKGYDLRTFRVVGRIGREGYTPPPTAALTFGHLKKTSNLNAENQKLLLTNSGLYKVTIPANGFVGGIEVQTILAARSGDYHDMANLWLREWIPDKNRRTMGMKALLRDECVEFRDPDGALKLQVPVARKQEGWIQVGLGDAETVYVIQQESDTTGLGIASYHTDGRLLSRRTVSRPGPVRPTPYVPAPLLGQPGMMLILATFGKWPAALGGTTTAWEVLATALLIACAALGLAAALLVIVRHVRYQPFGRWQRWLWSIALLLFPVFIIPVYFSSPGLVPTVRCPNCGRRRPLTRETCPWCAAPFPKRAPTGIELLSPTLMEKGTVVTQ